MKKLVFIALLLSCFIAQAQMADGKTLLEIDNEFIQIWITQSKSGSKVFIDYGQDRKHLYGNNNLTDEAGKDIKTLSHVPLINKILANGYDIVDIASLKDDNVNTLLYSFRKK